MNHKNRKIALLLAIMIVPFVFAACGKGDDKGGTDTSIKTGTEPAVPGGVHENGETKEELVPSDKIEFSDPGNDEIGQEIKEMDSLLNQTVPSEYSEDDLSVDVIEGEVELK